MAKKTIYLTGKITSKKTGKPMAGLRVEAWDKDLIIDDLLGSAVSSKTGSFEIRFDEKYYSEIILDRKPDIYFKVYKKEQLIFQTKDQVHWNVSASSTTIDLSVPEETPEMNPIAPRLKNSASIIIRGKVSAPVGYPALMVMVEIFDKGLTGDVPVTSITSDANGEYTCEIDFAASAAPGFYARATDSTGNVLGTSTTVYGWKKEYVLDIQIVPVENNESEYTQINHAIEKLSGGIPVSGLNDDQIQIIAGKYNLDFENLKTYRNAQILATKLEANAEPIYALIRKGVSPTLKGIFSSDLRQHRILIEEAVKENIISAVSKIMVDELLESIRKHSVRNILDEPFMDGSAGLGDILASSGKNEKIYGKMVEVYKSHQGSISEFWKDLPNQIEGANEKDIADLRFTVQIGNLLMGHLPFINHVQQLKDSEKITGLSDLAHWQVDTWVNKLDELEKKNIQAVPDYIPGDTAAEKKSKYARGITRLIEQAYPTQVLSARIKTDQVFSGKRDLISFLDRHTDFDITGVQVDNYIKENPQALSGIENKEQFLVDIKTVQVQYMLSPGFDRFESMKILNTMQAKSSYDVASMGWKNFSAQYVKNGGTQEMAGVVYEMASHNTAMIQNVQFTYGADLGIGTYVTEIPGLKNFLSQTFQSDPTLATLFGSLDYCECKHCRSIYSPAAYLVDLFQFIRQAPTNDDSFANCLEVLFNRRADLCKIDLNCDNTNTPLPYIDLVNEVLEGAIMKQKLGVTVDFSAYQTKGTAEELRAHPEHIQNRVYDEVLKPAFYPWSLPFDLWTEEGRVYLNHLKTPRYKIMDALLPAMDNSYLTEEKTVNELLGLSLKDRQILLGTSGESNQQLWGLTGGVNLVNTLKNVDKLLEKAGFEYKELQDLLNTHFINPNGNIKVNFDHDHECDLNYAELSPLTDATLMKIMRFTRLRNKLGWSVREMDMVLRAFGATEINVSVLTKISHIVRLNELIKLPLHQLLIIWGNIFTGHVNDEPTERSPYELQFLNKTVINPVDNAFALNASKTDLAVSTNDLALHVDTVKAGLGISSADLDLLMNNVLPDLKLTLANLSILYRHVLLAKALRITIKEFLLLQSFSGINPFDAVQTGNTILFVKAYQKLKSAKIKIRDLDYLLKSDYDLSFGVAPTEATVLNKLTNLHLGLKRIYDENKFAPDPEGDMTRQKLATILSESDFNTSVEIIEKTTSLDVAGQTAFINTAWASFASSTADAVAKLVNPGTLNTKQSRYEYVLNDVLAYLKNTSNNEFLKQAIAANLKLEVAVADALLFKWIKGPDDTATFTGNTLLDEAFITEENSITRETYFKQFNTYILLHKTALILNKFKVTSTELDYLFANAFDPSPAGWAGWFAFNDLPVKTGAYNPVPQFNQLLRLCDTFGFYQDLPASDDNLFSLMKDAFDPTYNPAPEAPLDAIIRRLSEMTKWELSDLKELNDNVFHFTLSSYTNEHALLRLKTCFDILTVCQTSASIIKNWDDPELSAAVSSQIVRTVRSLYTEKEWTGIAKPLRDVLRVKQRTALTDWLVFHQSNISNSRDLYAYYLIDPEMSSCMMTSRIRLALSAVQMFIQRCLMNLEPDVKIGNNDREHWDQWRWMKNYRLWEANRKVFCYPENWIEPELRDDKSEFFKELEHELSQSEIDAESVEKAYLNYLAKVEGVSNMDIMAICRANELGLTEDAYYIFGRVIGKPTILYFRKLKTDKSFTDWQKIDIDFEGDHLVPVIFNNKLHLFWPVLKEKSEAASIPSANSRGSEPKKYYQVQMAYSQYHNGTWTARKTTTEYITNRNTDGYINHYTAAQHDLAGKLFFISSQVSGGQLFLTVYYRKGYVAGDPDFGEYNQAGGFQFDPSKKVTTYADNSDWITRTAFSKTIGSWQEFTEYNDLLPTASLPLKLNSQVFFTKTPDDYYHITYVDANGIDDLALLFPFFYSDRTRMLMINYQWNGTGKYKVQTFYHPYISDFMNVVNKDGVEGLLNPKHDASHPNALSNKLRRQQAKREFYTNAFGAATSNIATPLPVEDIDFSREGAYSIYNWELFFHIPMLIADKLSDNQKFKEAQEWYHYIFDPTESSSDYPVPQRFWKVKPFVEIYEESGGTPATIQQLMKLLNEGDPDMEAQVEAWREDPFNPHLIARMRISAYQKNVVMKYIDNLFKWGDLLFRQDTMESTNEATQLYLLAWDILGEDPRKVEGVEPEDKNYCELKQTGLDDFSNAMVVLESKFIPYFTNKYRHSNTKFMASLEKAEYMGNKNTNLLYSESKLWNQPYAWENQQAPKYQRTIPYELNNDEPVIHYQRNYKRNNAVAERGAVANPGKQSYQIHQDHINGIERWNKKAYYTDKGGVITHTPDDRGFIYQVVKTLYFCIPQNDKLLGYWGFVNDRMYKLRHCMNIEGQVRMLPLFDPPIDPALLVKAAASGMDLSSALNDLNAPLPNYRFMFTIDKARQFAEVVKGMGSLLLSVLEKKDAEGLAQLRASNEIELMEAIAEIKKMQIREANFSMNALEKSWEMADGRFTYYDGKSFVNAAEGVQIGLMGTGIAMQIVAEIIKLTAAGIYSVPQFTVGAAGWAGSPVATVSVGGQTYGNTASTISSAMNDIAGTLYQGANLSGIIGNFMQRKEQWEHQADQAKLEKDMISKQVFAAGVRYEIAQKDLENHEKSIEQRKAEFDYLKTKFTNQELYDWMVGQVASLYFQAYQIAYDLAKRAERSYKYELAESNDSFISYGYWDSLKKGLLAGEKLQTDIMRMEASYLEKNKRTYEITKNVSLAMLDPFALAQLRENGSCFISIPEELYDVDHPGHYLRRIKTVSVTIPCVAGPYSGVNAKLTLLSNSVRINTEVEADDPANYPRKTGTDDTRFKDNLCTIQSIATSNAQNDHGLFVLNFDDARYLPFEGAGAISNWHLELPDQFRSFDYHTISDVILTIGYTAKDGGDPLRDAAVENLVAISESTTEVTLTRAFSMKHEFSTEFYRFLHPAATEASHHVDFGLQKMRFPYLYSKKTIHIKKIDAIVQLKDPELYNNAKPLKLYLTLPVTGETEISLSANTSSTSETYLGGQPVKLDHTADISIEGEEVTLTLATKEVNINALPADLKDTTGAHARLNLDEIENIFFIAHYVVE
jgi:predicted nucleic acid-binding protein